MFETLKYDYPVTALQFDTRKIVAATGENGLDVGIYTSTAILNAYPYVRSTTAQAFSIPAFSPTDTRNQ